MIVMRQYTEGNRPPLLDLLKIHGPLNVPRLAKKLGVNPTAVRQQLAVLQREGLVQMRVERRKVGRPTHVYSLSDRGETLFPQGYGPIALSILRQLRELDGDGKLEKVFARRTKTLLAAYKKRMTGKSANEKFRELARIRDQEGYMAKSKGRSLTEHHCPIAAIAKEFPIACRYEHMLFEAAVGMKLERTEHIASGGRACIYKPASKG